MRGILLALCTVLAAPLAAQNYIPETRSAVTRDYDFPGGDIRSLFDTTYQACETACASEASCVAFTFNSRSNSCFPKAFLGTPEPYAGAISAQLFRTPATVLSTGRARANELSFLRDADLAAAQRFADGLGERHPANGLPLDALLSSVVARANANDPINAMRLTGAALSLDDRSDLWVEYARQAAAIKAKGSEARDYRNRTVWAATNAYLRAGSVPAQMAALEVLANGLEVNRRGRDMIPALRLATTLQPRRDLNEALEAAIAKYGFRIVDTQVDSNSAEPRICANFSEPLAQGTDLRPFVQLPDQTLAVTGEGDQLCVTGVRHGDRYQLTFREGLPAASGEALHKSVPVALYVRDRTPAVRFPGRAFVLPKSDQAAVPVVTVNTTEVELTLKKMSDRNLLRARQEGLFGRPLSAWDVDRFDANLAQTVWNGTGVVSQELNQDVTTRLPLGEALEGQEPGIYALQASIKGQDPYEVAGATQWFIVTDLGIRSLDGADGLTVELRALGTTQPIPGAEVTLISQSNAVLATATADDAGRVVFAPGLTNGQGAQAPALLTARTDQDFAFLSLQDAAFDLSDRGVEGRTAPGAVDMFLTTDRGAYRAGETIHVTALARDGAAMALSDLPVTAVLRRPDGVDYTRRVSTDGVAGGHVFSMPLAGNVPRGTWEVAMYGDPDAPALATTKVLVEDFVPERIDFELDLPETLSVLSRPNLAISAKYLFGAPGANLDVEGDVILRAARSVPGFAGYQFGRHDDPLRPVWGSLPGRIVTDATGAASVAVTLPNVQGDPRPLEAEMRVRIAEGSARPVERRIIRPVLPAGDVIGLKPAVDGVVPEGTEASFQVVTLGPDLAPTARNLTWTLNRVETRYQWFQLFGDWSWEPVTRRTRMDGGDLRTGASPISLSAPIDWGRYELVVEASDGPYTASSATFWAGWYAPDAATDTPDTLTVALDRADYAVDDQAEVLIDARAAGTGIVEVLSNQVISRTEVALQSGENRLSLPVTAEWGTGAYVTVTLLQPMDAPTGRNPGRALGLAYAKVAPGDKALAVSLDLPDQVRPRGPLTVPIQVDGAGPAYVTLAAVDVGVLNITGFQSPDPQLHYFGQRRLGVDMRDLYGRLIDGLNGSMGQVRSGGDALAELQMDSPPPNEEVVAFFQGPITTDAEGRAEVTLDIPEFNGTLRVMAVAWSDRAVGQAEAEVVVRDPVVLTASLPRFLAPGDTSRVLVELAHVDGPAGRVGLDVVADNLILGDAPSGVDLTPGGRAALSLPVQARGPGDGSITFRMTTPEGELLTKTVAVGTRANDPEVSLTQRFTLDAGATLTLDDAVFAEYRAGTGTASVALGPLARFDAPGLLTALDRYPYGCTEQVTSAAMPLLYFQEVAAAMNVAGATTAAERIDQAITRVLARQSANGSFGLWRPVSGDLWLDAYVTDFLSRAKSRGFDVPEQPFESALDNLLNRVNAAPDFDEGGQDLAYALMVLAREGAAATGDLRYYADVKADAFSGPLAAAQLGAALAFYGDQTRADRMFGIAVRHMAGRLGEDAPVWRADYGTNRRDAAGVLALAVEAGSGLVDRATLAQRIAQPGTNASTQEAAWSLLAAHAMIESGAGDGFTVNGAPMTGPLMATYAGDVPKAITNGSGRETEVTLTTFGVPAVAPPAGGDGFAIERFFYALDGDPITLDGLRLGDRFVTIVRVIPFGKREGRLMVNDPLPAGIEIDNPSILRSGDIGSLDWLQSAPTQMTEFRSDRFLAAVDWRSDKAFDLAYIARAVSPGTFHAPAASVEDMYRPRYRAVTGTTQVVIAE